MKLLPLSLLPALGLALAVTTPTLADTSFVPWSYTGPDLFPSAIVSSATVDWNGKEERAEDQRTGRDPDPHGFNLPIYGDEHGWLGVELRDVQKGSTVEVSVAVDGVLKSARWSGEVKKATPSGRARIQPKATWDYPALLKVQQQRPVNVVFTVTVNGKVLPEKVSTYHLKSMNDCMVLVYWDAKKEQFDDVRQLFAGYVNENHPLVDSILQEALAIGLVDSFTGYQEDTDAVYRQVFAIWNVLQRRGIKYSNVTDTTPSKLAEAQTVRFLDQSLNGTQANCVDGSVLMASILTKIGIKTSLVLVPHHCFIQFAVGEEPGADIVGLETTLIGTASLTPISLLSRLSAADLKAEMDTSTKTCVQAVDMASSRLKQDAALFEAKKPGFMIIPIGEARKLGIMPLPFNQEK